MKLLKVSGTLILSSSLLFGCSNNSEETSTKEVVKEKATSESGFAHWGYR